MSRLVFAALLLLLAGPLCPADAAPQWGRPQRLGLGFYGGTGYDPGNEVRYALLAVTALYAYDAIWPHAAPPQLHFKLEGNLGIGGCDEPRLVAAAGMMARYYPPWLDTPHWQPFGEAGIGLIYTDFQVPGQGLRWNFNPRFGLGCDFGSSDQPWYLALHLHHLSNGELHSDNRGINALLLQVGSYF